MPPGVAQEVDFEGQRVVAPNAARDAAGQGRADALTDAGLQVQIVYLQKFDGSTEQKDPPKIVIGKSAEPLPVGPIEMALVVWR